MHNRFKQYLRIKVISQKEIAEQAGVSAMLVSRFCKTGSTSLANFCKLLSVCNDLSLDYLFFGVGSILREGRGVTVNCGSVSGTFNNNSSGDNSLINQNSTVGQDVKAGNISQDNDSSNKDKLIMEKDRIIAQKDKIISERDDTITRLTRSLHG